MRWALKKVEVRVEWRVKCVVFGEKQQGSGSEQRRGCRLVFELSDLTLVSQACVFPDEMQGAVTKCRLWPENGNASLGGKPWMLETLLKARASPRFVLFCFFLFDM